MIFFKRIYWRIKCKFVIEPLSYNYNLAWCLIMWFYISVDRFHLTQRSVSYERSLAAQAIESTRNRIVTHDCKISGNILCRLLYEFIWIGQIFFCSGRINIPSIRNWPYPIQSSLKVKTIVSWIDKNFVNICLFIDIAKMYKVICGLRYKIE